MGKCTISNCQNGNEITSEGHLGNLNSIRYRGYYYDTDTGMYYLQSRYYDPEVRRFINADDVSVLKEDQGSIVENNLFAYCLNNPVKMADDEGDCAIALTGKVFVDLGGMIAGVAFAPTTMIVAGVVVGGFVVYTGYRHYKSTKVKNTYKASKKVKNKSKSKKKDKPEGHRSLRNGSKKKTNNKHTKKGLDPRKIKQNKKKHGNIEVIKREDLKI